MYQDRKIKLRCNDLSNKNYFHWIIENLILFKWQTFKNNPRGNNLVIRSFLISICVPIYGVIFWYILHILLNETKCSSCVFFNYNLVCFNFETFQRYVLPLLAVIIIIYSSIWKDYHSKWEYCSNLFNNALRSSSEEEAHLFQASLAVDILTLDLWAHRSFKELFYSVIEEAVKYQYKDQSDYFLNTVVKEGKLTEKSAMQLLDQYQEYLVESKEYTKK